MAEADKYTADQMALIRRIESIRPTYLSKPWLHGFEPDPEFYHRLTIDWNTAKRYAVEGHMIAKNILGVSLYFTQSLIVGAIQTGEKRIISIILGTAYGKSYCVACSNLLQAYHGSQLTLMAPNRELNNIIRTEMTHIITNAPKSFSSELFGAGDKLEKLAQSTSKQRYGFANGGFVDNTIAANATGVHTSVVLDEYSLLSDDEAQLAQGRAFIGIDKTGKPFTITKITNPHFVNHSYRDMTKKDIAEDEMIIWADWRINIAEGKYVGNRIFSNEKYAHLRDLYHLNSEERNELLDLIIKEIKRSPFFNDPEKLKSLYLSEFAISNEKGFFNTEPIIDDSPYSPESNFYGGIDVASKGVDEIPFTVLEETNTGKLKVIYTIDLKPKVWEDLKSQQEIKDKAIEIIEHFGIKYLAIDRTGVGEFLYSLLGGDPRCNAKLFPINFSEGPTDYRVTNGEMLDNANAVNNQDYSAYRAFNKRAEMHLDLKYMMDNHKIYFSTQVNDRVHTELVTILNIPETNNGKIKIEDKKIIKKRLGNSPDTLDSVILALHAQILSNRALPLDASIDLYNILF